MAAGALVPGEENGALSALRRSSISVPLPFGIGANIRSEILAHIGTANRMISGEAHNYESVLKLVVFQTPRLRCTAYF